MRIKRAHGRSLEHGTYRKVPTGSFSNSVNACVMRVRWPCAGGAQAAPAQPGFAGRLR